MSEMKERERNEGEHLLNRTVEDEYVSELHKRTTMSAEDDTKKQKLMKIILLGLLFCLAAAGLISVIVSLVNRHKGYIEYKQETNMFKVMNMTQTLQKVTVELESKYKKPNATNDDEQRCVGAYFGELCETDNNRFIDNVLAEISVLGTGISRSVFRDRGNDKRWDVTRIPGLMEDKPVDPLTMIDGVGFAATNEDNFGFKFKDTVSENVLFDTTKRALIMSDKYLEMGFTLPTQILFGLGQHNAKFLLGEGDWTMFNRDQPGSPVAKGKGEQHLYGTHPFLMFKTKDNKFSGMLFYNSNPQQVSIRFSKSGKSLINYKTIGGILDVYYIMADTADEVIRKYNLLVGKPVLPPFWSLGFHQCSWAYNTTGDLEETVKQYQENKYPFDTIWSDIEYMDNYIDFTVDDEKFKGLKEFVDTIHAQQLHFVPIVDAGIGTQTPQKGTDWYQEGIKRNVFLKTAQNPDKAGGNLIGRVWPGYSAFVDFLHPDAAQFWSDGLTALNNLVSFDGIWLDMNEPSNFCEDENKNPIGECYENKNDTEVNNFRTTNRNLNGSPVKQGEFDQIPFTPGNVPLYTKTLSMDAYFHDENENGTFVMYNIHNLYGTLETMATNLYLTKRDDRRPLIVSRDSFVGHGKYGTIWTGDNDATQEHMELSINQIMNFNMFGMPFVGGDICGFGGNTTPELCARWAQVGAFYPFMRNHYANDSIPHEFYLYDQKYQKGMKESIRERYSLLRYLYTCLFKSSEFGDPTIRHPMYDWPDVDDLVKNENSFMIGPAIRITANFDISDTPNDFKAPFAKGRYLEYRTYNTIEVKDKVKNLDLYSGWDYPNVHIREGNIIPFQDASEKSGIFNTYDLLDEQMRLLIFPDSSGYAKGNLYIARGEKTTEDEQYYTIIHSNKAIQFIFEKGDITDKGKELNEVLEEIHIVVQAEDVLKADFACVMDKNQQYKPLTISTAKSSSDVVYLKISGGENTVEFDLTDTIFYGTSGEDYNYCDRGYVAHQQDHSPTERTYLLQKGGESMNNDLKLTLKLLAQKTIQLTINDGNNRFEVPKSALNPNSFIKYQKPNADETIDDYVVVSNDTSKFSLKIHEFKDPESVYFQINEDSLIFADYYLSLETQINTNGKLYGLGERVTDFYIPEGIYTTWAKDQTDPVDDGKRPGKNIYGSHPVYFTRSKTGNKRHWGMFNFNANAQDTKVKYTGELGGQISHYISGQGIFDMYFFTDNERPEDVVVKYHDIIGHTLLPPFWGMGWHQCKYGYKDTDALQYVYDNYEKADFPMDVLWSDIDHMLKYRDFTFDKDGNYNNLDGFIKNTLHANNRRYVPIVDAGIAIVRDGSYDIFDEGKKKGVFIKSGNPDRLKSDPISKMDGILYGKVWPGYAAFPDFTKKEAIDWWVESIEKFNQEIPFDGLWLDMNEVANFCTGPCIPEDVVPPSSSVKSKLVYMPGGGDIEEKCLSIDGVHSDGQTELNYHSLFGFLQGVATNKWFTDKQKRAFIISRSTFAGQGKYTSHWNGDNHSFWEYLKLSVTGVINMNLYGINFNGADICGFLNDTTPELCQTWTNVGAFYPFARNHDDIANDGQEPYQFDDDIQKTMRAAIRWRYVLLRYFYTQLYINHIHGGMFWKPLFFEFPDEDHAYDDVERNVMVGPAIKMSSKLDNSTDTSQKFIFPQGVWCNIIDYSCLKTSKIGDESLPTTPDQLNLHLRMGQIIPFQKQAFDNRVNNTVELNKLPMGLMINIHTDSKTAEGNFFADDGETLNNNQVTFINMVLVYDGSSNATITFNKAQTNYRDTYTQLDTVEIVGVTYTSGLKSLLKMKIDDKDEIPGTFYSGDNALRFPLKEPIDLSDITTIQIYKQFYLTCFMFNDKV